MIFCSWNPCCTGRPWRVEYLADDCILDYHLYFLGTGGGLGTADGEKKYGLKLFEGSLKTVKLWQWALVAAGAALKIYASVMDWGGFKVYLEWKSYGTLLFIFQYIYYVFETLLFTLILVFAQLAFETWFKNRKIPYGGIVMGLTWGLPTFLPKEVF